MAIETTMPALLGFISWGPPEMIIVGALAVLLFGNRLPSVARSMGRSFTEFKRGMQGFQNDFRDAINADPTDAIDQQDDDWDDHREPTATAFEPPAPEGPPAADSK